MTKKILSVIALAIAATLFFMYTRPEYDKTRVLRAKIVEYDGALEKAAELQRLKQTLLSRYNAMDPVALERLKKLLPDHVDNVRLILDLDTMASRHGMALENVAVGEQAEADTNTVVGTIGSGRTKFDSIGMRFSTSGTYTDFRNFILDLESALRVVDIVDLRIDRDAVASRIPSAGGPAEPSFKYTLTVRTYWLK